MPLPVAGHGTLIAWEGGATPTPGLFTTIAQLGGDIAWPELSRDETEITPHNDTIDRYVLSYIKRGPVTFAVNFMNDEVSHNHLTGLYKAMGDNVMRGWRISDPAPSLGVWIMSGQVQKIVKKAPVKAGVISAEITVRISGPQIIDGIVYAS